MTKNLAKWTSEHGQTSKIRPSDGCRRILLPLVVPIGYDCHGFEGYLGNVGVRMSSHISSILYCISLFTGLPVAAPPTGGIITAQMSRLWAYYVPYSETIVIGAPDPDDWLLAHELTHYLQAHAGVPSDERQATDAARHCSQATYEKGERN